MTTTIGLLLLILIITAINAYAVVSYDVSKKRLVRLLEKEMREKKSRDQRTIKH